MESHTITQKFQNFLDLLEIHILYITSLVIGVLVMYNLLIKG